MASRLMREQMKDDATANSPERVKERVDYREAGAIAVRMREERYPVLTHENAGEAMAYQAACQRDELRKRGHK